MDFPVFLVLVLIYFALRDLINAVRANGAPVKITYTKPKDTPTVCPVCNGHLASKQDQNMPWRAVVRCKDCGYSAFHE